MTNARRRFKYLTSDLTYYRASKIKLNCQENVFKGWARVWLIASRIKGDIVA